MKKVGIVCSVLTTLFMSGCNIDIDSGKSDSTSNSAAITTSTPSNSFIGDGIYSGPENSFMVVDSNRSHSNVIVSQPNDGDFYVINHTVATDTQLKAYGVTYIDYDNGNISTDNNFTATANFTSDSVNIVGVSQGQNLVFTMDKAEDVLPLYQIAGTYAAGGSEWDVKSNGELTLNHKSGCTIHGNLQKKVGYYYIEQASATGCAETRYNGLYEGAVLTLKQNGKYVIYGVLANNDSFLSDAVVML